MYSNQGARKSVDSLSPTLSVGHRGDFPFHGYHSPTPSPRNSSAPGSAANSPKNSAQCLPAPPSAEGVDGELHPLDRGLAGHVGHLVQRRLRIGSECHLDATTASHSEDWSPPAHRPARLERTQASDRARHPPRGTYQHPARRSIRVHAISVSGRRSVRAIAAVTSRRRPTDEQRTWPRRQTRRVPRSPGRGPFAPRQAPRVIFKADVYRLSQLIVIDRGSPGRAALQFAPSEGTSTRPPAALHHTYRVL
jgi:hypothetical protein